jgi:FMN phosphatase YigB (HAD superfamily)
MQAIDYSKVKAISLDVWGTLIEANPEYKKKRTKFFSDRYDLDPNHVETQWKLIANGQDSAQMRTNQSFKQGQLVYMAMLAMGLKPDLIDKDLAFVQKELQRGFFTYPPTIKEPNLPKFLLYLQEELKYEVVISCNTGMASGDDVEKILRHHGLFPLLPDKAVFSDKVGVAKPSPNFFQHTYDKANIYRPMNGNIRPDEILHLGDNVKADCSPAVDFHKMQTLGVHKACPEGLTVLDALSPLRAYLQPTNSMFKNLENQLVIYQSYLGFLTEKYPVIVHKAYEVKQV